jgi:hypothetical protein
MDVKIEFPAIISIACSLFNKHFLECTRADAKRAYRVLEEGKPLLLADVKLEDGSVMRFSTELLMQEFRGKMNFSALRNQLQALCGELMASLQAETGPRIMSDESGSKHAIFRPVFSEIDGRLNALLLAVDSQRRGELRLQLMYVDPEQFRASAA